MATLFNALEFPSIYFYRIIVLLLTSFPLQYIKLPGRAIIDLMVGCLMSTFIFLVQLKFVFLWRTLLFLLWAELSFAQFQMKQYLCYRIV